MFLFESESTDPYYNLALEEHLFKTLPDGSVLLMLWQNDRTVVIGKYQNAAEEIDRKAVTSRGIKVARRMSGGGAVYHDLGNLNYTIISDIPDNLTTDSESGEIDFSIFTKPVISVLSAFGVHAEATGRNDMTIDGRKFSGTAQYTSGSRILHHGCIMIDSDLSSVAAVLRPDPSKFESKSVKSVSSRVTTVNQNSSRHITVDEFKTALIAGIENNDTGMELIRYELTPSDAAMVEKLREEKYSTWEWNFKRSADYKYKKEKRYPSGLVRVSMDVKSAVIEDIEFSGDFFGNGEISDLENSMRGLRLDDRLVMNLMTLDIPYYISGLTPEDIAELIM